jgi:hypothetical protein
VSGNRVTFLGDAMAAVVQAAEEVRTCRTSPGSSSTIRFDQRRWLNSGIAVHRLPQTSPSTSIFGWSAVVGRPCDGFTTWAEVTSPLTT